MFDVIALLFLLLIIILIVKCSAGYSCCDEEVTTTTETIEKPVIAGPLKRQVDGNQFYVIDPDDQQKTWINSNDDMYEDAAGRIWRLV